VKKHKSKPLVSQSSKQKKLVTRAPRPIRPLEGNQPIVPGDFPVAICSMDPAWPVGNPFPKDSPSHRLWQQATLIAEQEIHEANATYRKMLLESPRTAHPNERRLLTLAREGWYICATFRAWAWRDRNLVRDEENLKIYDQRIEEYAKSMFSRMEPYLSRTETHYLWPYLLSFVEEQKSKGREYLVEVNAAAAMNPKAEVEDFIRKVRDTTNQIITKTQLARAAGISPRNLQLFQKGVATSAMNAKIRSVLQMSPEDFVMKFVSRSTKTQ
jgi:hypothetical protein